MIVKQGRNVDDHFFDVKFILYDFLDFLDFLNSPFYLSTFLPKAAPDAGHGGEITKIQCKLLPVSYWLESTFPWDGFCLTFITGLNCGVGVKRFINF